MDLTTIFYHLYSFVRFLITGELRLVKPIRGRADRLLETPDGQQKQLQLSHIHTRGIYYCVCLTKSFLINTLLKGFIAVNIFCIVLAKYDIDVYLLSSACQLFSFSIYRG